MISSHYSSTKIQDNISEQERNDKESMICLTSKPSQSYFIFCIQSKEKISQIKSFLTRSGSGGLSTKRKEGILTALATVIKKDPSMSIRKQANESPRENCEDSN